MFTRLFFDYIMISTDTIFFSSPRNVSDVIQFNDAPLPTLLSLLAFNNFFMLMILSEFVYLSLVLLVWRYTGSWIAFTFIQLAPFFIGISIQVLGVGIFDDYLGMLFLFLVIVSDDKKYFFHKIKLVYIFMVLTLLCHIVPSLYMLGYFVVKRRWNSLMFLSSLFVLITAFGVLGYGIKFNQVFTPDLSVLPFVVDIQLFFILSRVYVFAWIAEMYLSWIILIFITLDITLFFMLKKHKIFIYVLPFVLLPFILPFNIGYGPHSLVWRMSWMNIVLIPLLFYRSDL